MAHSIVICPPPRSPVKPGLVLLLVGRQDQQTVPNDRLRVLGLHADWQKATAPNWRTPKIDQASNFPGQFTLLVVKMGEEAGEGRP
jgi:hypothetical protein